MPRHLEDLVKQIAILNGWNQSLMITLARTVYWYGTVRREIYSEEEQLDD